MKVAVVLFNLGGPDCQQAVKPFLFNLFYDKQMLRLPNPLRYLLAWGISGYREKEARKIYAKMGGGSPINANTQAQSQSLNKALGENYRTFVAMRYWHPFIEETVRAVKDYNPDKVVLLPLYPQYSTTTTQSSFLAWYKAARAARLDKSTQEICCYPTNTGFVGQLVLHITELASALDLSNTRFLFSAHGLPRKFVDAGDPYQYQVEHTVTAVLKKLPYFIDSAICYQSRVGPLEWTGPSIEQEIKRASEDKKGLVVIPVTFVSEHAETLVELDLTYREYATALGIKFYRRLPTVSTGEAFIQGLRDQVLQALQPTARPPACSAAYCYCWQREDQA